MAAQGDEEELQEEDPVVHTITYMYNYDNRGTYKTETVEGEKGTVITDRLNREGTIFDYAFAGWSTNSNATPDYFDILKPGEAFDVSDDMTLYAVWGEYKWGSTLTAAGNGTKFVYDGNPHNITGITDKPDPDRTTEKGENYSTGFFYQPLWYSLNVWRYTYFGRIFAGGTNVGKYTTPVTAPMYAEIWIPWPLDNEWVRIEDTYTGVVPATMEITKAPLTVKADDQRAKYTGSAITPKGTIEGLVTPTGKDQETATLKMDSFTAVGKHPMTYEIEWDGTAKKGNYEVTDEELGVLTIYYELSFDANGGSGAPATMEVEEDTATIPADEPTLDGYTFTGWAKSADADSPAYQPGDTISLSDNTTLYAVWESNERTITYDLAGGTYDGSIEDIVETWQLGDVITIHEAPTRKGYTFVEWQGSSYQPGDEYTVSDDHTFTAVWKRVPAKKSDGTVDTGDSTNLIAMAGIMCAAMVALVSMLLLRRREKK